ncbi:MAG: hypothetical protein GF368_00600 [Candidatus Aenigmarchaeota archaeon]|nr:hypothetical protein [Candidatus Aenigmarchaeota archaeon]
MLNKIIEILSVPIMILNFVGGIIGGIWLAFLGEWTLIVIGVLFLFTSHWILSIFMMPNLLIAGIASQFYEKKNPLGHFFGFISQLYMNLLIISWCIFAFLVCSHFYSGEIGITYIPYLLWSWGMALGPWQFFASKEPDNEFSAITLFSASVFYFLFLISIFISPLFRLIITVIFGVVQLIILPIFNMYIANKLENY